MATQSQVKRTSRQIPSLVVRFTPIEPRPIQVVGRSDVARLEFWASVISEDPVTFASDIKLCEDRLSRTFAAQFVDHVRPYHRATPPGPYRFILLPPLAYGSLELRLGIEGAENLVAAFGGNVQLLIDVLSQYAPQAFVASIPIPPLLSRPVNAHLLDTDWLAETDAASDQKVSRTQTVTDRLGMPSEAVPMPLGDEQTESGRRLITDYLKRKTDHALWLIANTSLIVPVALSLVAIFVAFRAIEAERERLDRRAESIDKREAALRDAILAREARMFDAFHSARGASAPAMSASATVRP
jgi:hypothetical protein